MEDLWGLGEAGLASDAVPVLVGALLAAVKMAGHPPDWLMPTLAVLLGTLFTFLIVYGAGAPLSGPLLARIVVSGTYAGLATVGLVELVKRRKP